MPDSVLIGVEARAFNATIRNRRKALGLTQGQVAERAGVSKAMVGHLETLRQVRVGPRQLDVLRVLGLDESASPAWLGELGLHGRRVLERSVSAEAIGTPTYLELMPASNPEAEVEREWEAEQVRDVLSRFGWKGRRVAEARFATEPPVAYESLAREFGDSVNTVQQMEREAREILRHHLGPVVAA